MKLNDANIKKFVPAKCFKDNTDKINSLSFSSNGENVVSSSYDDQMIIYDCVSGVSKRSLHSKKYGVNLMQFTHSSSMSIHASTKVDDTIRYLSLIDNKYIKYFTGHNKRVVTLCMSPISDTFLSGSLDKTVRLWDLKGHTSYGFIHTTGRPIATFDPEGLVIAAGINSENIKLYDIRTYDKGPFATFDVAQDSDDEWNGIKFSPNGRMIAICGNGSGVKLIDSFDGKLLTTFMLVGGNPQRHPIDVCFTADSQYLVCGSPDGQICIWNCENKNKVALIPGFDHQPNSVAQPINCIAFNPKYAMLASGVTNLTFWAPLVDE